jgi:hypothetical protein
VKLGPDNLIAMATSGSVRPKSVGSFVGDVGDAIPFPGSEMPRGGCCASAGGLVRTITKASSIRPEAGGVLELVGVSAGLHTACLS